MTYRRFPREYDVIRAWALLPKPIFRPRDVYAVSERLGFAKASGQSLWNQMIKRGWILRTGTPIGNAKKKFYWERSKYIELEVKS